MRLLILNALILVTVFLNPAFLHADFGNHFIANQRIPATLDQSAQKMSYRFTCQDDMTLTAAAVYCVESLHAPSYLVSVQEDEGGTPSGTVLTAYNFIPKTQSWTTIPLNAVPLTKGKVYHLVLEPDMLRGGGHPVAVIDTSHYASFLTTDVLNHMHPNDGSPDLAANSLFYDKGKWRELDHEPVYAVFGTGDKSQGNPYDDPGVRPVYGNLLQGQALHFHCAGKVKTLAFRVKKQGHPSAPLKYSILINDFMKHKCIPYCTDVAALPDQTSNLFQWVTVGFPVTMTNNFRGECWFFVFQSDSGQSSNDPPGCEDCYVISDAGNSGGLAGAADLTFDGGPHRSREVYSMDDGNPLHWIDEFERDANIAVSIPDCPDNEPNVVKPIPTPLPLEDEPRFER